MPLLLMIPFLIAGVFALWVLLLPISVIQRYRLGKARRRLQAWYVRANAWLLAASTLAYGAGAWLLSSWVADALVDALVGLALGVAVGLIGLALDRFERTSEGMFSTPNRWLVLGLSVLVAGRIAMGLWLAWSDGDGEGATAWITHGGLIGVGGVLLGYALATAWGLRFRVARR